jgi:hypothetical protein
MPLESAALVGFLASCGAPQHRREDSQADERQITTMLDDWHDAAARADESRYFSLFAPGAVFLGTDATERWSVDAFRAYGHPRFAQGRAWNFHAVERHVTLHGRDTAWFDERLWTERLGPARGSGVVLRNRDGSWQVAQYNLALTIPNDRFDAVKQLLESSPSP